MLCRSNPLSDHKKIPCPFSVRGRSIIGDSLVGNRSVFTARHLIHSNSVETVLSPFRCLRRGDHSAWIMQMAKMEAGAQNIRWLRASRAPLWPQQSRTAEVIRVERDPDHRCFQTNDLQIATSNANSPVIVIESMSSDIAFIHPTSPPRCSLANAMTASCSLPSFSCSQPSAPSTI